MEADERLSVRANQETGPCGVRLLSSNVSLEAVGIESPLSRLPVSPYKMCCSLYTGIISLEMDSLCDSGKEADSQESPTCCQSCVVSVGCALSSLGD